MIDHDSGALNPYVSIVIIVVCAVFIVTTGLQFFSQQRMCAHIPVTNSYSVTMCIGHEQLPAHPTVEA